MNFRWIDSSNTDEMKRLEPIFEVHGWTPLNPYFSKVLIAKTDRGELAGFNCLQLVPRPEPIWVNRQFRGMKNGVTDELASRMAVYLREMRCPYWEIKAASPFVERICVANGMERVREVVFAGGVTL